MISLNNLINAGKRLIALGELGVYYWGLNELKMFYKGDVPLYLFPILFPMGAYITCDAITRLTANKSIVKFYKTPQPEESLPGEENNNE